MPSFDIQSFDAALAGLIPGSFSGRFCVAFSGGVDSSVLLHALAELRARHDGWRLRAIHVDHRLHPQSAEWARHCVSIAERLDVELIVEPVQVPSGSAEGLEAAARRVRYAALRKHLDAGELLVTAHHADDQAETVLLALLRGSGVRGLAAMPALKVFGRGWHLRPLLAYTRAELESWARAHDIVALQDPANLALHHDRNFLRHAVIPKLRERWPSLSRSVARSAAHVGESLGVLEEIACADLSNCAIERALRIDRLRDLSPARRRNVLRHWLRVLGLPAPSTRKLLGLEHDLLQADPRRTPCVVWSGAELHWHRGFLYAHPRFAALPPDFECAWSWREGVLKLPAGLGRLALAPTQGPGLAASRLPDRLTVRFSRRGEKKNLKIRVSGREHRQTLANLLREWAVLPWYRDRIPLIFAGDQWLAIAHLAWSDEFGAAPGESALSLVWQDAPHWRAVEQSWAIRDA